MKADLVSLFVADALHQQGYYTDGQLRSVYAGGIHARLAKRKSHGGISLTQDHAVECNGISFSRIGC